MKITASKDEWNTKEGTGKSMKNALYVLRYAKKYLLGRTNIKQCVALAIVELCRSEGIGKAVS